MIRSAGWFTLMLVAILSVRGEPQYYQGYLPVQTGGCEQATVTVPSQWWATYIFRQQDLDTWLIGGPNPREVQIIDTTCFAQYDYQASIPYWWVTPPRISLVEVKQDGTYRWRLDAQARTVTSTAGPFFDHIWLFNQRPSTDIFRDPDLKVIQSVYVVAVPPPEP
jgi:hypothetical protein